MKHNTEELRKIAFRLSQAALDGPEAVQEELSLLRKKYGQEMVKRGYAASTITHDIKMD